MEENDSSKIRAKLSAVQQEVRRLETEAERQQQERLMLIDKLEIG